jgi:hypothetical protein
MRAHLHMQMEPMTLPKRTFRDADLETKIA